MEYSDDAAEEKRRTECLLTALKETAGALSSEDHPEWATRERVASWVRETRQQGDRWEDGYRRG